MTQRFVPGEILAGKYRIERVLGQGGMGVVVMATHVSLDQRVAIKFLLPAAMGHPEVVARFAREGRAAAKIRGEHVARVIDVGELPDGAPYMVMEYLEGEDLAAQLTRRGPLPIEEAVDDVLQASEALAEAHAAGIVHRDIKPANLFAARTPDHSTIIKVLDFGISKSMDKDSASLTRTHAVLGSAYYLSPEQLNAAKQVDARADVWALGVVLYELITGHVPYGGESLPEVIAAILQNTPKSPESLRPDLPAPLAQAIGRCLTNDPSRRFQSVYELAQAIGPFAPRRAAISLDKIARVLGVAASARAPEVAPTSSSRMLADMPPPGSSHAPTPHAQPQPSHGQTDMRWTAPSRNAAPRTAALAGVMAVLIIVGLVGVGVNVYPRLHVTPAAPPSVAPIAPLASSASALSAPSSSSASAVAPSSSSSAVEPNSSSSAAAPNSPSSAAAPSTTNRKTKPPTNKPARDPFSNMDVK